MFAGTAAAIAMSAKSSGKGGSGKNGSSSQNAQTAGLIQRIRYAARCPPAPAPAGVAPLSRVG